MIIKFNVVIEGTQEEIKKCIKDATKKDFSYASFSVATENDWELTLEKLEMDVSVEDATDVVDWLKKQ